jgi:hypothetical protein
MSPDRELNRPAQVARLIEELSTKQVLSVATVLVEVDIFPVSIGG